MLWRLLYEANEGVSGITTEIKITDSCFILLNLPYCPFYFLSRRWSARVLFFTLNLLWEKPFIHHVKRYYLRQLKGDTLAEICILIAVYPFISATKFLNNMAEIKGRNRGETIFLCGNSSYEFFTTWWLMNSFSPHSQILTQRWKMNQGVFSNFS